MRHVLIIAILCAVFAVGYGEESRADDALCGPNPYPCVPGINSGNEKYAKAVLSGFVCVTHAVMVRQEEDFDEALKVDPKNNTVVRLREQLLERKKLYQTLCESSLTGSK